MNKKAVGIGLFALGLALVVAFTGRLAGSVPGIVFMILGVVFLVTNGKAR
jgi:hypothetical protein